MLSLLVLHIDAHAQLGIFERLVVPGPVIESHAQFEEQCDSCHFRFERTSQRDLCLDCHTEIAADLSDANGFHGLSADVGDRECASCHADHEGRDADVVGLVLRSFNHNLSRFPLRGSHQELGCANCHSEDEMYHAAETECVACHVEDDNHSGNLGEVCSDCHRTTEWIDSFFDHELLSGFALTGSHESLNCANCHSNEQYVDTSRQCIGCHLDDDAHEERNGTTCESCHRETQWMDVSFSHARDAGFALNGIHAELDCNGCHLGSVADTRPETSCVGCHSIDDPHQMQLGEDCGSCHGELTWTGGVRFDHNLTSFPLLGTHGLVQCEGCHQTHAFLDAPEQCIDCHRNDDIHRGELGTDCAACHVTTSFTEIIEQR